MVLDISVWSIDNGENDDKPWHLGPSFEAYISTVHIIVHIKVHSI